MLKFLGYVVHLDKVHGHKVRFNEVHLDFVHGHDGFFLRDSLHLGLLFFFFFEHTGSQTFSFGIKLYWKVK